MRAVSIVAAGARHFSGVAAQALLIAAIIAALALALGPVYRPADFIAGTDSAAAGRSRAWLSLGDDARTTTITGGSSYTIVGGGFDPAVGVAINLAEPGCCRFFTVWPSADGTISFTADALGPGTYEVRASQRLNPRKLTPMAQMTFEVGG